jgi:hypothetical protein
VRHKSRNNVNRWCSVFPLIIYYATFTNHVERSITSILLLDLLPSIARFPIGAPLFSYMF